MSTQTQDVETGQWAAEPNVGDTVWWFDHEGCGPIAAVVVQTPTQPTKNRAKWMPEPPKEGHVHLQPLPSVDLPRGTYKDEAVPRLVKLNVKRYVPKKGEPERHNTWRLVGETR